MRRILLAHSGGLQTSAAIPWLAERYQAEVVVLTLDLGQGQELTAVRERALAAGAVRAHVIDAREEFVRDYILPALQAGAFADAPRPLAPALGRALIATRAVQIAQMESASAIACGPGLEAAVRALEPSRQVIVTAVPDVRAAGLNVDVNLWGRSVHRADMDDTWLEVPESLYTLTRAPRDCPDEPAYLQIDFESGIPLRANGIEMPMLELIESLEIIGGAHGVGRIELVESDGTDKRDDKCRIAQEGPAGLLLQKAYSALERLVVARDLDRVKRYLGRAYADLVHDGRWSSPTREAIDAFVRTVQPRVTGSVRLKLFKGHCRVVGRRSPFVPGTDANEATAAVDQVPAEGLAS
jgi:argininosuccinate synthase